LIEAKLGSTPYITKDTLTDMLVKIPTDKNEQKAIAEVLSDMDNEIENLKMKRDKYKKLKE
jgi:type I restriction enzyme S subunit